MRENDTALDRLVTETLIGSGPSHEGTHECAPSNAAPA